MGSLVLLHSFANRSPGETRNRTNDRRLAGSVYRHQRHHVSFDRLHGDNGALRDRRQPSNGWTGLVVPLIEFFGQFDARAFLEHGRDAVLER
jgi:hypothetical protein